MASKVDAADPHVRKAVYNMYRGILNNYNPKANSIIATLPKERVVQDQGIGRQLESMMRQSSQIGGNGGGSQGMNSTDGPPPPPPPVLGNIPSQKLYSEVPPMRKSYEPPAAIQNAMMTKDKKPFTYTPGGLDLAEIRSPRMAKRISRNAHMEDSCTPPQARVQSAGLPQPLPPAALAAMQPQIAIPVFPPGGVFTSQATPPPLPPQAEPSYSPSTPVQYEPNFPPPPPLPSDAQEFDTLPLSAAPPPPPPPPPAAFSNNQIPRSQSPSDQKPSQQNGFSKGQPLAFLQDIQNRPQLRSVGPINQNKAPADFVAEIPVHAPLKPINHPPRSSYDPISTSGQIPVALKPLAPKPIIIAPTVPQYTAPQPPQSASPEQAYHPPPPPSQIEAQQVQQPTRKSPPPASYSPVPSAYPSQIRSVAPPTFSPGAPGKPIAPIPALHKAPAPWMTTRQTSKDAPLWTGRQSSVEEPHEFYTPPMHMPQTIQPAPAQQMTGSTSPITRVIPIQIEGRESSAATSPAPFQMGPQLNQMPYIPNTAPSAMTPQQQQYMHQQQILQQQQQLMKQQVNGQQAYIPPNPAQTQAQLRTRIIPIQFEAAPESNQQGVPQSQASFAQRSNSTESTDSPRRPLQTQTSWTGNPTQSRSFRVLQKITGSEDEPAGPFPAPPSETFLVNRVCPPQQAASPVGADISKCWNPNTPPPIYPNPNYWYHPPQTPEEQQQFWEHYNAMCAYMAQMNAAACRYSPYPMYPYPYLYPSDSEEYSGYSSSDEMTYYGQMFKQQAEMARLAKPNLPPTDCKGAIETVSSVQLNRGGSESSINSEDTEKADTSDASETDTEVEDEGLMNPLRSIRSVPNINVYHYTDEHAEDSEESDDDSEVRYESDREIPHQLSVIFEESETSDVEGSRGPILQKERSYSNDSSSRSNEDYENDVSTDSTVTVRLPLQFKFSRLSNDEEVATVIVGNSEVESQPEVVGASPPENLIITEIIREDSDPDVTATICLKRPAKKPPQESNSLSLNGNQKTVDLSVSPAPTDEQSSDSNSPVDFWRELSDKESPISELDLNFRMQTETPSQTSEDDSKHDESDYHSSSTSIQTVKKGLSGSENLSGSETETPLNTNANYQFLERTSSCDEVDEDEVAATVIKESTNVEEYDSESSESSSEESESSEEDEAVEGIKGSSDIIDEASITRRSPNSYQEQSTYIKVPRDTIEANPSDGECQNDISEAEEDTNESDMGSSSSSSSSGEEEDEEDEAADHHTKTTIKKECPRSPPIQAHKSQEESEEDDSGVTSDLSRHISETDTDQECGGEFRKMTRYQRAATHSRLFKLLQDECKVDESPEELPVELSVRKERLTLPLQNQYSGEQESLSSSSGINSPSSPTTTDKLVKELVKSLLSRKKGRHFRKLPLEKLHAAALRILQEDMDPYDTASTSDESNNILSPVPCTSSTRTNEPNLANPEVYGDNYYDYCKYYSTWGDPDNYGDHYGFHDEYEFVPSKAFRALQENSQTTERPLVSPIPRIAVRCPRVSHPPLQAPNPPPDNSEKSSISESSSTSQET